MFTMCMGTSDKPKLVVKNSKKAPPSDGKLNRRNVTDPMTEPHQPRSTILNPPHRSDESANCGSSCGSRRVRQPIVEVKEFQSLPSPFEGHATNRGDDEE